jgi:hypothetical protein
MHEISNVFENFWMQLEYIVKLAQYLSWLQRSSVLYLILCRVPYETVCRSTQFTNQETQQPL